MQLYFFFFGRKNLNKTRKEKKKKYFFHNISFENWHGLGESDCLIKT